MNGRESEAERGIVLVVDDDADICVALEMLLEYEGFEVWTAKNARIALARLEKEEAAGRRPAAIFSDVKMPGMDGMGLLAELRRREVSAPVLMISGHGDIETAVEAVRQGAADFLEKPLDQNRLLVSLHNALRATELARENTKLRTRLSERWKLVGTSAATQALREEVARAAGVDVPVLITGENGTGKEVVARLLHSQGPRCDAPFVAVNCAAIPAELIESELFGHEKGSFTGAEGRRIGHFEAADGGTLFLDEIGDMPLAAQAKVLRALETREVRRVGGNESIAVDIRVVAATNADLAAAVEAKSFRLDLLYRLNVLPIHIRPLRERPEDVAPLVAHFLGELAARTGRRPPHVEPEALDLLRAQSFPGNVRQLRNLIEAAHVFAEEVIRAEDIERILANGPALAVPGGGTPDEPDPFDAETFEAFKNQSEARFFRRKLAANQGNVKRTAEQLGMQRSHLYKKLDRYGLR